MMNRYSHIALCYGYTFIIRNHRIDSTSQVQAYYHYQDKRRREKHRIGVYFTQTEERKHPNDLNVSSGLPFDERFENEPPQERTAFVDPFDAEPDWKTLDGLDFLLWHLKFNLHATTTRWRLLTPCNCSASRSSTGSNQAS